MDGSIACNTKFNATYGKELHTMEFANNTPREIMVFPNRKRNKG